MVRGRQDGEGDAVARSIARALLCGFSAAALGFTGCAGTYDLVTSERFKERPFHTLFTSEDPVKVLETAQEGDDRVKAMKKVDEPKEHGGSAADQDHLMTILKETRRTIAARSAGWPRWKRSPASRTREPGQS